MTSELIIKLRGAFKESAADEKQVVFILSKIRKLLENENLESKFPLLKRHTDWALHSTINNTSPMKVVLQNIEQTILSGTYQPSFLLDMVDFIEFRKQLIQLLAKFAISNRLNEDNYWREFRKSFVRILIDCPLRPNFGEMTEFCFRKGNGSDYDIDYEIKFKMHPSVSGSFSFPDC